MANKNAKATKLQEVIMAKTLGSLNNEETKKNNSKKAVKAETKKTTSEDAIIVKPLKEKKSKKTTAPTPVKETKKEKAAKKEAKVRELKYTYPADCTDALAKKKFRAGCRAKVKSFTKKLESLKEGTKEYKAVMADFKKFRTEMGLRG